MAKFDKSAIQNNVARLNGTLNGLTEQSRRLAESSEHADQQWDFAISQVNDEAEKQRLEGLRDEAHNKFRERFANEIEAPTDEIYKEINDAADELFEEANNEMAANERIEKTDVDKGVKNKVKTALMDKAREYDAMGQEARDLIAKSQESIAPNLKRIGLFK